MPDWMRTLQKGLASLSPTQILGFVLPLWGCVLSVGVAQAAESEEAAIVAVPTEAGISSALATRFGGALPTQLRRAGLSILDPRAVDLKMAERPDLVTACQKDICLITQARVLGVRRLVVPRMAPLPSGVSLALTLYDITPANPPEPARVERMAEAVEACQPCQGDAMDGAVRRAAERLQRSALKSQTGQLRIRALPEGTIVRVDGEVVGPSPAEVRLTPGEHLIVAENAEGRSERKVLVRAREELRIDLLVQGPEPPPAVVPGRPLKLAKWVVGGLGVAALIAGGTIWALDGRPQCDLVGVQRQCPELLDSRNTGIALVATGAAALSASAVMFAVDYRKTREGDRTASLLLTGRF